MAHFIEVKDLIFEYVRHLDDGTTEQHRAVDGVSLNIDEGEFVAIVGRNGSGKSTFAKHLNGLLVPTSGDVLVDGMDTKNDDDIYNIRRNVGMVFQNPDNQIVSSIIEDDVAFGPENMGVDPVEIRERVDEALKNVGMYDVRRKSPHMLSGGQKQRIAIAGAIAMRPRCIVFDEPTAMLDPSGRKTVLEIIKKLNEDGITVILITHFMEEAIEAKRMIVMDAGKIFSDTEPAEFFEDTEKVRSAGLELPVAVELMDRIASFGVSVPHDIIAEKDLVDYICR